MDTRVFQQDSTLTHCACDTTAPPHFIAPDLWPQNSPDLNPVDYKVWSVLQEHVYHTPILNTNHLKQRLIAEWSGASCYQRGDQRVAYTAARLCHHVINEAINEWCTQQRACIIMLSMRRSTSGVHSSTPVSQLMGDTWNVFSEQAEWINCFLLLGHLPILLFDFVDTLCLALNLLLALQGTVATCQV